MRLSRLFKGLMLLALVKLALLAFVGWNALSTGQVTPQRAVARLAAPAPAQAQEQKAVPDAKDPTRAKAVAKPAADDLTREALLKRQEELDRRERELDALEGKINKDMAELDKRRAQLERMLEEATAVRDKKDRHLVDVFSNMKAKQAAQVLQTMDERQAVKILSGMRGRQAGEILTFVDAQKAARLAEALTKLQVPFE
ncbi:MotE family protein [Desulfocurvus sp. DL9XJH121]